MCRRSLNVRACGSMEPQLWASNWSTEDEHNVVTGRVSSHENKWISIIIVQCRGDRPLRITETIDYFPVTHTVVLTEKRRFLHVKSLNRTRPQCLRYTLRSVWHKSTVRQIEGGKSVKVRIHIYKTITLAMKTSRSTLSHFHDLFQFSTVVYSVEGIIKSAPKIKWILMF